MNINNILSPQNMAPPMVAIALVISLGLGLIIAYTYRKTHSGISYYPNFTTSLIYLSIITTIVMMVIGNSLARAFGLVGALSVIRFRTAIKDVRDICFIFFALIIGMATGTLNFHIAFSGTLFLCLVIFLTQSFQKRSFGGLNYILKFSQISGSKNADTLLAKHVKSYHLLNINQIATNQDEFVYQISTKSKKSLATLLEDFNTQKNISNISIFDSKLDIEC